MSYYRIAVQEVGKDFNLTRYFAENDIQNVRIITRDKKGNDLNVRYQVCFSGNGKWAITILQYGKEMGNKRVFIPIRTDKGK